MKAARILETAIYCRDLDAAEAFYGGVLSLEKRIRIGNRHVFYDFGDAMLLVFNPDETVIPSKNPDMPVPAHGSDGNGHVCFAATRRELEEWHDIFAATGVPIEAEFTWPNGARSIYVRDPGGNSVEFAEPKLWFDD